LWLVDNFLSPNFRRLLPALAAEVGFAVSRVTYKWPAWLREQTEKQRVIWAYKILFLDVFFPLQVKRVLFIDADQIVRADIKELWDIDLKGRVYGMVPFCGSGPSASSSWFGSEDKSELRNPETVGLRFWEQGFWQSHLGSDRYYHISALFVVDLVLFRQVGAGDILRDVYQSLTADPHSLSNLDQDLPNYVQARQLPIFSLPPEWLWCETWCSEATKPKAKTIDMCQNPVRKEGKLQQARRIAPEWTKYDEQLAKIIEKAANATDS
jgi:UDP-glucose:glycoprotein glucosyltransferase